MASTKETGLKKLALDAWQGAISNAPGATGFAEAALQFAHIDSRKREIVIDLLACVQAVIVYGSRTTGNSAAWLVKHFEAKGKQFDALPRHQMGEISKSAAAGFKIVLSRSVMGKIAPSALNLTMQTVKRSQFDLRHLIVALFREWETPWSDVVRPLLEKDLDDALLGVVSAILANPERGESKRAWQDIIQAIVPDSVTRTAQPLAQPQNQAPLTRKERSPPPEPAPEALPIHTDDPALVDQLGREGFATVLAQRIDEAHARAADRAGGNADEDANRAFIVHMHGPWGSGKSTVLNFIRRELETGWIKTDRPEWLVVDFNAWKLQRLSPPWWTMMVQVQKAAEAKARDTGAWLNLKWRWIWMRFRLGAISTATIIGLFVMALLLGAVTIKSDQNGFNIASSISGFASLLTTIGGLLAFGKTLVGGGDALSKTQAQMALDPYAPITRGFAELVARINKPIIVFIDDLDRCDSAYVCDLLESIQTMLRAAPITYLIAADRKWICTSFEKRYADFSKQATDAGRPLGYQFLDKLFQISANLPVIPQAMREGFWNGLLHRQQGLATVAERAELKAEAAQIVEQAQTPEAQQAAIRAEADPVKQQAIRAEVALKQSSPEQVKAAEHRLKMLGALIEPNPRAMKRLANAVGMNQARLTLEGRDNIPLEAIARWTILDLRWPLLADWLIEDTARISARTQPAEADPFDKAMAALLVSPEVALVVHGGPNKGRLTQAVLRALLS